VVKNILKYFRRTKDVFLVYGGEEELIVFPNASNPLNLYCDNNGVIA
jgi:hypothetical protein